VSDLFDDLEAEMIGPDDTEVPAGADDADRLLRRVARIDRELAEVDDLYAAELLRLTDWRDRRRDTLGGSRKHLVGRLELYLRALQENDRKLSSVDLPNGRIVSRKQQPEWVIDEEFVPWAESHAPELLRTPPPRAPAPDVRAIKALGVIDGRVIDVNGEVVPGVTVTERDRKYDVEVSR
jgi:hypothetical protein